MEQTVMIKSGKWRKLKAQILSIYDKDTKNTRYYIAIKDKLIAPLDIFQFTNISNLVTNTDKINFKAWVLAVKLAGKLAVWAIGSEDLTVAAEKDGNPVSSQQSNGQPIIIFKDLAIMFLEIDDQISNYDAILTKSAQELVTQVEEILNIPDYMASYLEVNDYTLNTGDTWVFIDIAIDESEQAIDMIDNNFMSSSRDLQVSFTLDMFRTLEAAQEPSGMIVWFNKSWVQQNTDVIEFLDLNVDNLSDAVIFEQIIIANIDPKQNKQFIYLLKNDKNLEIDSLL
jgi:hypothetical protein